MWARLLISFILTLLFENVFTQIPQSPNKINPAKERDGVWTILYDSNGKETSIPDSMRYYQINSFIDGKPVGIVRDYYRSGTLRWKGGLKSLQPPISREGLNTWYFENGNVKTRVNYTNNKENGEYHTYSPDDKTLSN